MPLLKACYYKTLQRKETKYEYKKEWYRKSRYSNILWNKAAVLMWWKSENQRKLTDFRQVTNLVVCNILLSSQMQVNTLFSIITCSFEQEPQIFIKISKFSELNSICSWSMLIMVFSLKLWPQNCNWLSFKRRELLTKGRTLKKIQCKNESQNFIVLSIFIKIVKIRDRNRSLTVMDDTFSSILKRTRYLKLQIFRMKIRIKRHEYAKSLVNNKCRILKWK